MSATPVPAVPIPNDDATASPPSSLEDLIAQMSLNYPAELRNVRGVLPDHEATRDLKADADRMRRLSELAQVDLTQTAPGQPDRAIIADVAVRGQYVSFVVLDEAGVPSNGAFSLAALDGDDDAEPLRAATQTPVGLAGTPGVVPGGTATVPTVVRDGKPQAPVGVPADIDELGDDEVVELLVHPPAGVDPRAVASYVKAQPEPSRDVVMKAFDLGLYGPNTSGTGLSDAQARQAVAGPGTTPEGGDSLPGPEAGGTSSDGSTSSDGGSTSDPIADLKGAELAQAASDANIDTSKGGSRADGGLTADEIRAALRAKAERS